MSFNKWQCVKISFSMYQMKHYFHKTKGLNSKSFWKDFKDLVELKKICRGTSKLRRKCLQLSSFRGKHLKFFRGKTHLNSNKLHISCCDLAEMRNVCMVHWGRRYGTIYKHMLPSNYSSLVLSNCLHIVSVNIDYTKYVIKRRYFPGRRTTWLSG